MEKRTVAVQNGFHTRGINVVLPGKGCHMDRTAHTLPAASAGNASNVQYFSIFFNSRVFRYDLNRIRLVNQAISGTFCQSKTGIRVML